MLAQQTSARKKHLQLIVAVLVRTQPPLLVTRSNRCSVCDHETDVMFLLPFLWCYVQPFGKHIWLKHSVS